MSDTTPSFLHFQPYYSFLKYYLKKKKGDEKKKKSELQKKKKKKLLTKHQKCLIINPL